MTPWLLCDVLRCLLLCPHLCSTDLHRMCAFCLRLVFWHGIAFCDQVVWLLWLELPTLPALVRRCQVAAFTPKDFIHDGGSNATLSSSAVAKPPWFLETYVSLLQQISGAVAKLVWYAHMPEVLDWCAFLHMLCCFAAVEIDVCSATCVGSPRVMVHGSAMLGIDMRAAYCKLLGLPVATTFLGLLRPQE